MQSHLRTVAQRAKVVLTALMIAWGTFAAVVAFAVRYEIGVFASPSNENATVKEASTLEQWQRPRISPGDWSKLLGPNEIIESLRAAIAEQADGPVESESLAPSKFSLLLDYRLLDSTAVWNATYEVGCDCPYDPSAGTSRLLAVIDPLSGVVLGFQGPHASVIPAVGDTLTGIKAEEVRP